MELKVELLPILTGGSRIAIISEESANSLGVHSSDRIRIKYGNKEMIAIANIAEYFSRKSIGLYDETAKAIGVKEDETVMCS